MSLPFTKPQSKWRLPFIILATLIVVVSGLIGVCEHMSTTRPEGNPDFVELDVERGISFEALIEQLEEHGLVRNRLVARYVLRKDNVFKALKAGRYRLKGDLTLVELSQALQAGPNVRPIRRITIKPGESLYEVAITVGELNLASSESFLRTAQNFPQARSLSRHFLGEKRALRKDGDPWLYLEGLLAADTYFLDSESTLSDFLEVSSKRFHAMWSNLRANGSRASQKRHAALALGDYELLILASMVEKETRVPSEARRIAGVFLNRLERGMRLKSDPTAMYHSDKIGKVPTPTETRDKTNPYNTYMNAGLPPGPICAPGPNSLSAVFDPEEHNYLFFVAARDGSGAHVFATTGQEHMRNVNRHLRKR